jgi:hypothetical protein
MTAAAPTPSEFAYASPAQRRGLGAWSLAVALIAPVIAILLTAVLWLAFASGSVDPWTLLGVFLLSVVAVGALALVTGILAIVLGGLAVSRRRGRGLGIAGIVVGSLSILAVLLLGAPIAFSQLGA